MGPEVLAGILAELPQGQDPDFLVGFDQCDDAAVYRLSPHLALVHTLDFFPPMVDDPYLFGQIAAANALSDIWAMGGEPKTALNIVCFPEKMDLDILRRILQGGSTKVLEAGAVLAGGHTIVDVDVKYGLSVTGIVDPERMYTNRGCRVGDLLILTKPLGVGIICAANRVGEASEQAVQQAVKSMATLNKHAAEILRNYPVHACTDVTGFGFLGHLHEMLGGERHAVIFSSEVPAIPEALAYAQEFLITGAAQRNRNYLEQHVQFDSRVEFSMEEVLFDPQTSGGLLVSVPKEAAPELLAELHGRLDLPCAIVGEIVEREAKEIVVL
jgi:selenide,water dikinase